MSEHNCNDGCHGSYKPKREIIIPKAKLPLILTERLLKNVPIKGLIELGSLLYKNEYFFTEDDTLADKMPELLKDYEDIKVNLICPINTEKTKFTVINYFKGKTTVLNNYQLNTDIAPSFSDDSYFKNFCDDLKTNNYSFIPVPLIGMLTLKSILGVLPYDFLLAKHYLNQYINAVSDCKNDDIDLLNKIKEEGLPTISDDYNEQVKLVLRIERKLHMQYNTH